MFGEYQEVQGVLADIRGENSILRGELDQVDCSTYLSSNYES